MKNLIVYLFSREFRVLVVKILVCVALGLGFALAELYWLGFPLLK